MSIRLRSLIPRSRQDKACLAFFTWSVVAIYWFEAWVVLPSIYGSAGSSWTYYTQHTIGVWLLSNILANIWYIVSTDTSTSAAMLSHILKEGYSYCSACESNRPSRAYHCVECNRCILKRDHHCVFVGKCIGHFTLRYYMMLLLHLLISLTYANILNIDYILDIMHGLSLKTLFILILPIPAWCLGLSQGLTFIKSFMCSQCLICWLFIIFLFILHARNLAGNQTSFERNRSIVMYDVGVRENIRHALGDRWPLVCLLPLISSQLPSDGVDFPVKSSFNMIHTKTI